MYISKGYYTRMGGELYERPNENRCTCVGRIIRVVCWDYGVGIARN